MGIHHESFDLAGAGGERVRGDLRRPEEGGPFPVVVVVHGFKGFRNWGFFPWFGERFANLGFATLVPDLSHNGTGPDGDAYPRPDLFRASTWATHQADLDALQAAIDKGTLPGAEHLDRSRVAFVGHSLGGGLVVLHALRHPGRLACVAGLAPVAKPIRFGPRQIETWRANGELPIVNARTGEVLPLGVGYLEDAEARAEELDIPRRASALDCPLLVVHGEEDTSVPAEEGRSIAEQVIASGRAARFVGVPGTQHTFGAVHPFAGSTDALDRAFDELAKFLTTYLVRFDPRKQEKRPTA